MGVVNTKASAITNGDASPKVLNFPHIEHSHVKTCVGTLELAAADSDGSTYRFARIPSSARVKSIKVFCDAITAGTAFDCGLYDTADNGGLVVLDNAYANNFDLSTAITVGTEIAFQNRDIANAEKLAWQDAGLASDPGKFFDLVLTGDTVGTAAGTVTVIVDYVI